MRSLIHYTYPRSSSLLPSYRFSSAIPWAGLESDIDRLFETALSNFVSPAFENHFPVDLFEDKDNTYVRAELPGVNRSDINVEMVNGYLTINATRKDPGAQGQDGSTSSVSRSISVPENVQADKVTATCENGILTVTLPKQEEAKPKKITVAVN
jgi:HSP20 family protein